MPPPLLLRSISHTCPFTRIVPSATYRRIAIGSPRPRTFTSSSTYLANDNGSNNRSGNGKGPVGPNTDNLPHVSEEAGEIAQIMGEEGPDVGSGKTVEELVRKGEVGWEGWEKLPGVMREEIGGPEQSQEEPGISGDKHQPQQQQQQNPNPQPKPKQQQQTEDDASGTAFSSPHLTATLNYPPTFHPPRTTTSLHLSSTAPTSRYPLPSLPLPSTLNLKHRYTPLITQTTNLLMTHGKKSLAQKNMQTILSILRTKGVPKPTANRGYSLVSTCPPLSSLPSNPITYLAVAIDSLAPLMRLKSIKGSGGFSNQVPVPLNEEQRRRTAVRWIILAANGKKGRLGFAERVAEEVVAVVEGKSSAWERRLQVHRTAVGARANVSTRV